MWFTQHSLSSHRPVLTDFSVSKQNGGAGAGPDSTATTATSRNGARIDGKPPLRGIGMHVHRLVGNGLNLLSCIELREAPECSTTRLTRHLSGGFRVPNRPPWRLRQCPHPPQRRDRIRRGWQDVKTWQEIDRKVGGCVQIV